MTSERRILYAFVLSAVVLLLWQSFVAPPPKPMPVDGESPGAADGETLPVEALPATATGATGAPGAALPAAVGARLDTPPEATRTAGNDALAFGVAAEGSVLTDLRLRGFPRHGRPDEAVDLVGSEAETIPRLFPLALVGDTADLGGLGRAAYVIAESGPAGFEARLAAPHPLLRSLRVAKALRLDSSGCRGRLTIRLENPTETPASLAAARIGFPDGTRRAGSLLLHWGDLGRNLPPALWRDQSVVAPAYANAAGKIQRPALHPGFFSGLWGPPAPPVDIRWAALDNRYFVAAFVPRFDGLAAHFESETGAVRMFLVLPTADVPPGGAVEFPFDVYFGPKSTEALEAVDPALRPLDGMEPSVLPISLARITVKALRGLERLTGNYGWAIVAITILVRIVLAPLTVAQIRSMEKMKALQPRIEEMKAKYGEDKERLNREMLKVYSEAGANPLGGCLPIVLQIPVFVALYQTLQAAVELRGAPFALWMLDLSAPDTVFTLAGIPVNILPALMGVTMLWQQAISTPPSTDPSQAQTMKLMTVVFTVMFWSLPSGLTLYWTIQNILSIGQQYAMERARGARPPAAEPARK